MIKKVPNYQKSKAIGIVNIIEKKNPVVRYRL